MKQTITEIKAIVRTYFKNASGQPYELTDGQAEIFIDVIRLDIKWLWLSAPTRYGKSDVLALGLIYLAVFENLKIPIVAGSEDKARKIMEYIVAHVADHPILYQGLINLDLSDVEKLKVSMSKDKLRWASGGWIYITSVDSRNVSKEGEGVVGEGGDVVVLEEAGLIRHKEQFSKIVRMPEGNRGWGKLIQSGNCIEGSVFADAYKNDLYKKVRIGLDQAIAEGRYTQKELEEKKSQTTSKDWKRYYLVEFPAENEFTYFKPKKYDALPPPTKLKYFGTLDPALGKTKKGSLTSAIVLAVDDAGQMYEVEAIGEHLKPDESIRRIFNLQYLFQRFGIEAIQFQSYFLSVIEAKSKAEGRYIPFEGIQQKRSKEERIESLEPYINTGQILFKGEGILWEHMQDYPNTEFLDVLDALEMCVRMIKSNAFEFSFV
jgi:predicted phage terminase large subunit-like protein